MDTFEKNRIEKINKLKDKGVEPYGASYNQATPLNEVIDGYSEEEEGKKVRCTGRIVTMRPHGKAAFLHIKDWTGKLQVYIKLDKVGEEKYDIFRLLDLGDIIGVEGEVFKTRTGEITVFADDFTVLSKALLPPPEKWHGLKDVEMAAELCLPHRIRRKPFENVGLDKEIIKNHIQRDLLTEVSNV